MGGASPNRGRLGAVAAAAPPATRVRPPHELACYRAFGPDSPPLTDLAQVAGTRWTLEEGFQQAKATGLDQGEVRTWQGRHRHITLCLLAHAFLAVARGSGSGGKSGGIPS